MNLHLQTRILLFVAVLSFAPSLLAWSDETSFNPTQVPGWSLTPAGKLPAGASPTDSPTEQILSVVDYIRQHVTQESLADLEAKGPRYNRLENFGTWIRSDDKSNCFDTRAKVLIRSADPSGKLTYTPTNCAVVTGLWHDPYASTDFKVAKAVQIDHVVPLKHIYLTGAAAWEPARRCNYANFLHNDFQLLAVSGHENMSKGDKGPEGYLPPTDSFQCEYVADWMRVKTIWQLVATQPELDAIESVIQSHHCSESKFQMTDAELQAQRDATADFPQHCKDFGDAHPN